MKLVCVWCCKEVESNHDCANPMLFNPSLPHDPWWSRKSINEIECLICGRSGPHSLQVEGKKCV